MKFCLFTSGSSAGGTIQIAEFLFFAHTVDDLRRPERRFTLAADDIARLNPSTRTCPIFRSQRDAELNKSIYRRIPVLVRDSAKEQQADNAWGFDYMTKMFDMADSSHEFIGFADIANAGWKRVGLDYVDSAGTSYTPLYEAKHIHIFDHRWGANSPEGQSENDKSDPDASLVTRYWVLRSRVDERLSSKQWQKQWLLGWRDITNTTNERTCILSVFPRTAAAHTLRVAFVATDAPDVAAFQACLSCFSFDYVTRQKVGGTHLTVEALKQLPVLAPATYADACAWAGATGQILRDWLLPRALELTYTAWDLEAFAQDCGWFGAPFRWDEERRFQLRCELDAAFFHLYGLNRDDTAYILDTFPIVKRKDEEKFGTYRTKARILELYDALAECQRTGKAFVSSLSPAPASFAASHPWNWEVKPLVLPAEPRTPLPEKWQYVVNVMLELVWQAGGSLPWHVLRTATDLLSDRKRLARLAELQVGQVALDWQKLNGDTFDAAHRWDQISGFCHAGKMRVVRRNNELVVELLSTDGHVFFPHVRFDARLALTVARTQPVTTLTTAETNEERRVAELIPA